MRDWEEQLWRELLAGGRVLPPPGGSLLVLGDAEVADFLAGEVGDSVLIGQCGWGETPAQGLAYNRVLLVADDALVDFSLALQQVRDLLRTDGKVVIVAARPWPWALVHSNWQAGERFAVWKRWLRWTGWRLEFTATLGFGEAFHRLWLWALPFGGAVRVMVASRRKGGSKVPVEGTRFKVQGTRVEQGSLG